MQSACQMPLSRAPACGFPHLPIQDSANPPSLRPGGQDVAGQILWRRGRRVAYLYRIELARPVRPMTAARARALEAAMQARRTCPTCRTDRGYVIPTSLGACVPCVDAA